MCVPTRFFLFKRNNSRRRRKSTGCRLKEYILEAGVQHGLHLHSLRHTFATWLVQDGVPLHDTVNRIRISLN